MTVSFAFSLIGAVLLVSILLIAIIGYFLSVPGYKGPASDHFDGKRFINPGGVKAKGLESLPKWAMNRKRDPWKYTDVAPGPPPPERVDGDEFRITFVNHATFLIQVAGLNILTDPVWSKRVSPLSFAGPKRMRPPGLRLEDLPPIDILLLSHNHYDHLDLPVFKQIALQHKAKVFTCLGLSRFLAQKGIPNSTDMDWWDELTYNEHLTIQCTPAQHFSSRGTTDRDKTLWGGFMLKTPVGNLYFCGDTGYGEFLGEIGKRSGPIRLAMLPIGAYKPRWFMSPIHIDPDQAVRVHQMIGAQTSVAMHYGTFPLADEGMHDPATELKQALTQHEVAESEFILLQEGIGQNFAK